MTSTPPLDAIRPYTTGDFAMDECTELELKHVFERKADRLAKAVAEAEVAQDQDRACEIALAALSR